MSFGFQEKVDNGNDFNFNSSVISFIFKFSQHSNANSYIFETFEGMKTLLTLDQLNDLDLIVCKLEFEEISTCVNIEQYLTSLA